MASRLEVIIVESWAGVSATGFTVGVWAMGGVIWKIGEWDAWGSASLLPR